MLKSDLNLYPYSMMTVLPKLTVQNKDQRMAFVAWAQNNVSYSEEAHFHLDGVVNQQNVQFWTSENPLVIHEKVHHALRITMWVTISIHGLLGLVFFHQIVSM
jgi:hypothetical protein